MGFDNECIVNIQSLAGEYFCPVCRLLVYPNEALQAQCTHLYCKPCLTYTVSTTRACPYDGYLVTEADAKPLTESDKTLAETIGKVAVHCLYHRSGCTWQGSLSECTSHCSGCVFGNSPVVCNRCGIQIVHRQVQEHAQNCPGVQAQVQQSEAAQKPSFSGADVSTDQNQAAAQVGATTSQALTTQTVAATTAPGQDLNVLANTAPQTQPSVPTAVQPNAEQWYQQQQYQQYYQQYSGYDPYQQQYQHQYPYQSTVAPQYQQYTQACGQPQPQALTQAQPQFQPQTQAQGHSQPIPHAPVALQSQNQMQVSQQQQVQPTVQQHSQIQSLGNPSVHGPAQPQHYPYLQSQPKPSQPQSQQPMQMPQYQQLHPQMQQSQPQAQQPAQNFPISQPQSQHLQPHAPVQHIPQSQLHPQQPNLPGNLQPQSQNASAHALTGHHSYPQPQAHQNMQMGAPQRPMNLHPSQGGPLPHSQQHGHMPNQFSQQFPMMRPHQTHAMFPNQQQPALFPAPVQGPQQQLYVPGQQPPAQANHHPVMHAIQQPMPPQSSVQQLPMPSHLRPQGPATSFPEHAQTHPQRPANVALSHNSQSNQPQNAVGRPVMPNHTMLSQPFAQTANASLVRPMHAGAGHLHGNLNMMVGLNNQVQVSSEFLSGASDPYSKQGALTEKKSDSASGIPGKSVKDMDKMPASESEVKIEKDIKQDEIGNEQKGEGVQPVQTTGMNNGALENGSVLNKNAVKEEAAGSTWQPVIGDKSGDTAPGVLNNTVNEHSGLKDKEIQQNDDRSTSNLPLDADNSASAVAQTFGTPQGAGVNDHGNITPLGHGQSGGSQLSCPAPFADQGKYGSSAGQGFPTHSGGIPSRQNQGQAPFHPGASNLPSVGSHVRPQFGTGDMHGGTTANLPPHASESYPHHRPGYLNGPHGLGSNEERFKAFPAPHADAEPISKYGGHSIGPHNRGSHGLNNSSGYPAGAATSRFFPPPYSLNDVRERPVAFHDDAMVKSDTAHRSDYLGIGSRHGLHHMDGLTSRSPVGEHAEIYLGRAGVHSVGIASKSSIYDFDGRDPRHFGDSFGPAFRDGRFSHLPSHFHRGEFEGPGSLRIGEHPRGEFIGQDDFTGHFRRGDHLGPHKMPRHLPLREPLGFGAHAGHVQSAELGGPQSFESFIRGSRSGHPRLGEPGFRSSFSLPGFPNDGGLLTGDIESFDNLKRRKSSMGWCRICKVDCETVEGLDLHSQTMEHQRVAMDMVKSIKKNAKKHKLAPSEQSSIEDGNKSRNTSFEGRGNKH
ncbi:hypothetical protein QN277_007976 [Acacia crassicarpa]|uniref:RING-type domain-containing protein n=1 Tax=Acacia crassicarpa TaxID=499986 RepID=A0AAE1JNT9_9FABA|nr:hypothetical protein QN277_007976 [Acacia crassicarpa]